MPYLAEGQKKYIDLGGPPLSAGELNYAIHSLLDQFFKQDRISYGSINTAIGALECVKMELYRRLAAPYEDKKKEENGDISLYESFGGV